MVRKRLVLLVLGVALLATGGAALFVGLGDVPAGDADADPGGDGSGTLTDYPTGTPMEIGDSDSTGDGETAPFSFTVDAIEECGQTCRDVTVTLTNQQSGPATDVEVLTRIYAGQDNTESDDRIWEGRQPVGDLDPGESFTGTQRVELSLADGLKVERADGWVTVVTTVRSSEGTVTFKSSEQVA